MPTIFCSPTVVDSISPTLESEQANKCVGTNHITLLSLFSFIFLFKTESLSSHENHMANCPFAPVRIKQTSDVDLPNLPKAGMESKTSSNVYLSQHIKDFRI